jgi:vancomycin resistance protein YoaR
LSPVALLLTQAAILVVALLVVVTFLTATNRGHIYPGVAIAGVPVGGLSAAAAEERIAAQTVEASGTTVTLTVDGRTWQTTPEELGVAYDVPASVAAAMAFGRDHHTGAGLLHAAGLAGESYGVALVVHFDQARFDAYVDGIESELGQAPRDASLAIDWVSAVVTPAETGHAIDRAAAREALLAQAVGIEPIALELPLTTVQPAIGTEQAEALAARIDAVLAAPFAVTLGAEVWTIAPEELATLIVIERGTENEQPVLVARLDEAGLADQVAEMAARVDGGEAVDAWIEDLGTHLKLHAGSQVRTVRQDDLLAAVQAAFAAGEGVVELPVDVGDDPVVTADALMGEYGITTLLASGDSDFGGSDPNRAQNIRIAVSQIDGTLVPPYGIFSYNDALGWIADVPGFVEAGATTDGIFQIEIGGGVCQVSTTVFRTALKAGFPIVEWWPHVYRSAYYEQGGWSPGYDASIAQVIENPAHSSDFRFRNPTDGWLLIRARAEGTVVRVDLFGPETGFTVELDEEVWGEVPPSAPQEIVDWNLREGTVIEEEAPLPGVTVAVNRRVYDANGDLWWEDSYTSSYAPQDGVYRVSPDMEGTVASGG